MNAGALAVELPWLLVGVELGLDALAWPFFLFSAVLWLAAGVYASGYLLGDARRHRFLALFLAAMVGNLGLLLARDAVGFYLFYAVMSFSTYGLVVHEGGPEAGRAARVYMVMVVLSEVLVLTGLLAATHAAGGHHDWPTLSAAIARAPARELILALLLAGFGVKAGALLLHVWLPLAHSLAPTPASAVLSGAMLKAGLVGWMRVLPLGTELPRWADVLVALGLAAAFYGVAVGLTQRGPKPVLAYSSVSQMGFLTVGVGLALRGGEAGAAALVALPLYALHHGLVKGALFLGVGVARVAVGRRQRAWVTAGLVGLGLSLAGAPLTSGALAKAALKAAAGGGLVLALSLAAVGTTLLLARFLFLVLEEEPHPAPGAARLWGPWVLLAVLSLVLAWGWAPEKVVDKALSWGGVWAGLWPVLLGVLGAWAAHRTGGRSGARLPEVPTGDVGVLALRMVSRLRERSRQVQRPARAPGVPVGRWRRLLPGPGPSGLEALLRGWASLEWGFLLLVALVFLLLAGS